MTSSSARSRRTAIRSTSSRTARPRSGMHELARRLDASGAEAAILATPHGTLLDGHFGVVRSARLTEHPNQFVDADAPLRGRRAIPSSPTRASRALQEAGLPALGLTFGDDRRGRIDDADRLGRAASRSRSCASRRSSSRRAARSRTTSTCARARRSPGRPAIGRVAFIASADHGHGHTRGRSVRLQRALPAVRRRRAGRRAAEAARRARGLGPGSGRRTRWRTASGRC